jgi:hypothetical protein
LVKYTSRFYSERLAGIRRNTARLCAVWDGMTAQLRLACSLAFVLLLASPAAALAQDSAKAGLVISSSGAISLIWHVTERVALRPELGISGSKVANSAQGAEATQQNLSPGIAALFYLGSLDKFRVYVSPRYSYARSHSESSSPFSSSESTVTTHVVTGAAGVQFTMHKHFAAFGESGFAYNHAKTGSTTNDSWINRSVAGVIWYF